MNLLLDENEIVCALNVEIDRAEARIRRLGYVGIEVYDSTHRFGWGPTSIVCGVPTGTYGFFIGDCTARLPITLAPVNLKTFIARNMTDIIREIFATAMEARSVTASLKGVNDLDDAYVPASDALLSET